MLNIGKCILFSLLVTLSTGAYAQSITPTPTPPAAIEPTLSVRCSFPSSGLRLLKTMAKQSLKDAGVSRGGVSVRIVREPAKIVKISEFGNSLLTLDPGTLKFTANHENLLKSYCKEFKAVISARGTYNNQYISTVTSEVIIVP